MRDSSSWVPLTAMNNASTDLYLLKSYYFFPSSAKCRKEVSEKDKESEEGCKVVKEM